MKESKSSFRNTASVRFKLQTMEKR